MILQPMEQKEILESINNENLIIVTNERNLGIGLGATKAGIKKALEIGAEIIIKFDGGRTAFLK